MTTGVGPAGALRLVGASLLFLLGCLAPALAAEPEWQVLTVPEDGFTVELPAKPQHRVNLQDPELFAGVSEHGADLEGGFAMISVFTFLPDKRAMLTEDEILDLGAAMIRPDCRIAESAPIAGGPGAAWQVAYTCPDDVTIRYRLHLYGDRLYRLAAGGPRGVAEGDAADRFFQSFDLVD